MNKALGGFLSAFSLSSRVAVKVDFEPDYSRSDFWIPIVGVCASIAALGGACLGQLCFRSPLFAALASMAAQYAAFNVFHLDGLLDSADAMMCVAEPGRRLEILKDSSIGTYAFFAGFVVLSARLACLYSLGSHGRGIWPSANLVAALLAAPAAGRAGCSLVSALARPARERGLGILMRGHSAAFAAAGLAAALVPLFLWSLIRGEWMICLVAFGAAFVSAAISGLAMAGLYTRKAGGYTGDALGAAAELGELFCLLVLAAAAAWLEA